MGNPRYAAFVAAHGKRASCDFMSFIQFMLGEFAKTKGGTHSPLNPFGLDDISHNEFTNYINENAKNWKETL